MEGSSDGRGVVASEISGWAASWARPAIAEPVPVFSTLNDSIPPVNPDRDARKTSPSSVLGIKSGVTATGIAIAMVQTCSLNQSPYVY